MSIFFMCSIASMARWDFWEFGYGQRVYLRCRRPFEVGSTGRLKRALLPANARNVERFGRVLEEPEPIR